MTTTRPLTEITADEAVAALHAGAFTEDPEPEYEPAHHPSGNVYYLNAGGEVTDAPGFINVPNDWRPLYLNVGRPGRRIVHCRMSITGADWDLGRAIELVRNADRIAWVDGSAGHDLAVRADGKVYRFQVSRPAADL